MDIKNVTASLKYGKFFHQKIIGFLYFAFGIGVLMLLLSTVMAMFTFFVQELIWNSEIIIITIFLGLFGILLGGTVLCAILKNDKHKKEILLWLEETIELNALVRRLDLISPGYKPYQVQVDFEIDGEKYYKISAPGNLITGYHKIFAKYDNKKVRILYSQKYDQVLILKNN